MRGDNKVKALTARQTAYIEWLRSVRRGDPFDNGGWTRLEYLNGKDKVILDSLVKRGLAERAMAKEGRMDLRRGAFIWKRQYRATQVEATEGEQDG